MIWSNHQVEEVSERPSDRQGRQYPAGVSGLFLTGTDKLWSGNHQPDHHDNTPGVEEADLRRTDWDHEPAPVAPEYQRHKSADHQSKRRAEQCGQYALRESRKPFDHFVTPKTSPAQISDSLAGQRPASWQSRGARCVAVSA